MKLSSQLIVAALVGTITVDQVSAVQRHHHHHHSYVQTQGDADTAGDAAGAEGAEAMFLVNSVGKGCLFIMFWAELMVCSDALLPELAPQPAE